jgi:outer membrane immunogenic protein
MKRFLISATAISLALSAGAALAADLPSRKEAPVYVPPPPPPPLWTGFYVGLNAGGTFANNNNDNFVTGPLALSSAVSPLGAAHQVAAIAGGNGVVSGGSNGGFIGGGQVGYNFQFYNSFVVGLEADIQGVAASNGNNALSNVTVGPGFPNNPVVTTLAVQKSLDYLGTVRGRIGYLVTPTLLVYGTGGLAYGGGTATAALAGAEVPPAGPNNGFWTSGGSFSNSQAGWTVGGGLEWMFMPNWSAKVEYLYYDLGSVTATLSPAVQIFPPSALYWASATTVSTRLNGNIVRAGVNYHFNWGAPAPVVAKY